MRTSYTHAEIISRDSEAILAPAFVEFVKWVLKSAGEHNIRRIYFLARDGYPMYRAAQILCQGREPEIECRYLRCSRYAFRIPAFHLMGKESVEQICLGGIDVTLEKVLRRGALTDEEIREIAKLLGKYEEMDRVLSYGEIQKLKRELLDMDRFWEYVNVHAREAYDAAIGYLKMEGLMDAVRWAVADSGWTGSMQMSLRLLLESAGYRGRLTGYYFGLYHIPEGEKKENYHAYYFEPFGKIKRKVNFSNSLFECMFSEAEHMTLAYRKNAFGYEPVKEKGEVENREALEIITDAVEKEAKKEAGQLPIRLHQWHIPCPDDVQRNMAMLMSRPSQEQAQAFGNLWFNDDVRGESRKVAAPLTEEEIRNNQIILRGAAMTGIRKEPVKESAWMEGSIVLGGKQVRWHLWQNRIYKYILNIKKQIMEKRKK